MSWQRVRGHDALIEAFDQVVRRGRLAHAYLFTGPAGVGKRLFAGELAKAFLCEGRSAAQLPTADSARPVALTLVACDVCPACLLVEAGNHPDLFTASRPEESLEFPIDNVRELCRNLSLKPARGRYKIALVDDADDLNEQAANCFLKTLEEPPRHSLLILVGTTPERQLPTVVSRCQVVRFAPLAPAQVAELVCAQGVEDRALAERVARISGGSPGQARELAEAAVWEFRGRLLAGLTAPEPDPVALAKQWVQFLDDAGKEASVQRRRAALVLRLLINFLTDALRRRVGGTALDADPEDRRMAEALAGRADPDQLVAWLERCLEADSQIDWRAQLVLIVEALLDALTRHEQPTTQSA